MNNNNFQSTLTTSNAVEFLNMVSQQSSLISRIQSKKMSQLDLLKIALPLSTLKFKDKRIYLKIGQLFHEMGTALVIFIE